MPKTVTPRRVRSDEDRKAFSSDYMSLDEGEKFLGYALFEGDPKEDEAGYYEAFEHWLPSQNRSAPCADPECNYCDEGNKPRPRAQSAWLVTQTVDKAGVRTTLKEPKLMVFRMGPNLTKQFTELRSEGDKILGQMFRVTRVDEKTYTIQPKAGETINKTAVKEALKGCPDFEEQAIQSLNKSVESDSVRRALRDDDDDDDAPAEPAKGKGRGRAAADDEEADTPKDSEMPDEADDAVVTVMKALKSKNQLQVEHDDWGEFLVWGTSDVDVTEFAKGDTIEVAFVKDDDGDYVLTADPTTAEAPEPEEEPEEDDDKTEPENDNDLPDEVEDQEFVVTSVDPKEAIIGIKSDELGIDTLLYFLDSGAGSETDFDDYDEGDTIVVSAEKDSSGDLVATAVPAKPKAAGKGKGKAAAGTATKGKR